MGLVRPRGAKIMTQNLMALLVSPMPYLVLCMGTMPSQVLDHKIPDKIKVKIQFRRMLDLKLKGNGFVVRDCTMARAAQWDGRDA